MSRYEIVRDMSKGPQDALSNYERHPEQPENGFASATEASLWCDTPPRDLGGEWYIRPVEGGNG